MILCGPADAQGVTTAERRRALVHVFVTSELWVKSLLSSAQVQDDPLGTVFLGVSKTKLITTEST